MRCLVLSLGLWLAPIAASAQLPDPPVSPPRADVREGREVFVMGMERARAEDWQAALELFSRSYRLSGSPVALFNLASTLRSLDRVIEARDAFDRLLSDPTIDVETQRAAERMRAEVSARVARLVVDGVPGGGAAIVTLDADAPRSIEERPIELSVDPGPHALEIAVGASAPWRWRGQLEDGATLALDASFDAPPEETVDAPADLTPWVVLGVGLGVVAAAIVIGVVADAEAQLEPRTPYAVVLP